MKETKLKSKQIFKNNFLELCEDDVLLPNQKQSKRVYVKHPGAACVLPITTDGKIILVKQFRYPVGEIMLEIPAGKKDDNESGYDCIKRELEEETGYQSNNIDYQYSFYNCIGYSDENIEFFVATDCFVVENPLSSDEDEFCETVLITVDEAKELLYSRTITDVKTILALQYFFLEMHHE